jgi:glucokinase
MRRAAMLAAEADKVFADPCATANDKVRVCNAANRAHEAMVKALQDTRQVKTINPFDAYASATAQQKETA